MVLFLSEYTPQINKYSYKKYIEFLAGLFMSKSIAILIMTYSYPDMSMKSAVAYMS